MKTNKQSQRDKLKEVMRLDEKDGLYSEQLEPEGERPTIKEYFGDDVTLARVHETYIEQPELFQYAQALDRYIDSIESSPQQPSEEEIEKILYDWIVWDGCVVVGFDSPKAVKAIKELLNR